MADNSLPSRAEYEAAGLYDPQAAGSAEQLALLEYLSGLGATLSELAAAMPDGFGVLVSDIALWSDRDRLTLDEVAIEAGVDTDLVSRTWRSRVGAREHRLHCPPRRHDAGLRHLLASSH